MQEERPAWLEKAGKRFEKASWPILAVSALVTGLLLLQLVPDLPSFHTDLAEPELYLRTKGNTSAEKLLKDLCSGLAKDFSSTTI